MKYDTIGFLDVFVIFEYHVSTLSTFPKFRIIIPFGQISMFEFSNIFGIPMNLGMWGMSPMLGGSF